MVNKEYLDKYLQGIIEEHKIAGMSVAVTDKQGIVYEGYFGIESIERPQLTTSPDTLYKIASITKVFNALTNMILVDRGLLELDEPVKKHLPELEFSRPGSADKVTLRHLLTHSAGLSGDIYKDGPRDERDLGRRINDLIPRLEMFSDPGDGVFLYSNYGFAIASYLAQTVGKKPFTKLVRELVLEPLQMDRTFYDINEWCTYPISLPHKEEDGKFSVIHNRGCIGACNFCALAYHQGRIIASRSHDSVVDEVQKIVKMPDFKGYIHDVGGPTANFRHPACDGQLKRGACKDKKCMAPTLCPAVKVSHDDYLTLLRRLRQIPGVKKVFIRSGIRFDYVVADKDERFFKELIRHHVSGQLKVAPEHVSDRVLKYMGKPSFKVYEQFKDRFYELTKSEGKKQYLVPYLMSSHPGSTVDDAIKLARFLKKEGLHPEQVQDFYPTPGTVSTCMFYTGLDPNTLNPVYVPRTPKEKAEQRALLQYYRPENRQLVLSALRKAGRHDLIGTGPNCLVAPDKPAGGNRQPVGARKPNNKTKKDRFSRYSRKKK